MKQKIRINESTLRKIVAESVKRTLNELDWKTYRNAARYPNKTGNPSYGGRRDEFAAAARKSFNEKYGFKSDTAYFTCGTAQGNCMEPELKINPYGMYGTWYPVQKEDDGYYLEKSTQHNVNDNYERIDLSNYLTDEEIMKYENGMEDWKHYIANDNNYSFRESNNGDYEYDNGWELKK